MKVTVVTCTYNSAQFIRECLDSVTCQTYGDVEHLVIDAFSTDGTLEIIEEYDVRVVQRKPGGISDAMNAGILEAKGDIIAHLHSDDYYMNDRAIEVVVDSLQSSGKMWSYGKMGALLSDGTFKVYDPQKARFNNLFWQSYIMHQTVFIAKQVFGEVGMFDTDLKYAMDLDLWFRIMKKYDPVYVEHDVACFRKHDGSTTEADTRASQREALAVTLHHAGSDIIKRSIALGGFFKRNYVDKLRNKEK